MFHTFTTVGTSNLATITTITTARMAISDPITSLSCNPTNSTNLTIISARASQPDT